MVVFLEEINLDGDILCSENSYDKDKPNLDTVMVKVDNDSNDILVNSSTKNNKSACTVPSPPLHNIILKQICCLIWLDLTI